MMILQITLLYAFMWYAATSDFAERKLSKSSYDFAMANPEAYHGFRRWLLFRGKDKRGVDVRQYTVDSRHRSNIAIPALFAVSMILFAVQAATEFASEDAVFYISIAILFAIGLNSLLRSSYVCNMVGKVTEHNAKYAYTEQTVKRRRSNEARRLSELYPGVECTYRETVEVRRLWQIRSFWIDCGDKSKLFAQEKIFRYAAKPAYYFSDEEYK